MWLIWIAATCAGVVAMTLMVSAARPLQGRLVLLRVFLVAAQVPGILVLCSLMQQRALRYRLPGEKGWLRRTALGVLVGIPVSVGLAFLVAYMLTLADPIRIARTYPPGIVPGDVSPGGLFALMGFVMLGGILLSTSLAQWRLLRRHSPSAGWWIVISSFAWAIALLTASKVMFPNRGFLEALVSYIIDEMLSVEHPPGLASLVAAPLVLGLVAGAITGAGLLCILKARPPDTGRDTLSDPQQ